MSVKGRYNFSRNQSAVLITIYQKYPILYQISNEHYHNRTKRMNALQSILNEFHEVLPDATSVTLEDVRRKINIVRTQFFAELNKVKKSAGTDSIFTPTLWCYDSLSFLNEGCPIRSSDINLTCTPTLDMSESESTRELFFEGTVDEFNDVESSSSREPTRGSAYSSIGLSSARETTNQIPVSRKRKHWSSRSSSKQTDAMSLIERTASLLEETRKSQREVGEIEAFGMLVVAEMKNIKSSALCRQLRRNIMNMIHDALESEET